MKLLSKKSKSLPVAIILFSSCVFLNGSFEDVSSSYKKIDAVLYGDKTYAEKISICKEIASSIEKGAPGKLVSQFLPIVKGFVEMRPKGDCQKLLTLRDLVKKICSIRRISTHEVDVKNWLASIENDLQKFKLRNGEAVCLTNPEEKFASITLVNGNLPKVTFNLEKDLSSSFKITFQDGKNAAISISPLFYRHNNLFYKFADGYFFKTSKKNNEPYFSLSRETRSGKTVSIKRPGRDSLPLLQHEELILSDAGNAKLTMKKFGANELGSFKGNNFKNLLGTLRSSTKSDSKLKWIKVISNMIDGATSEKEKSLFLDELTEIYRQSSTFSTDASRELRTIFMELASQPKFEKINEAIIKYVHGLSDRLFNRSIKFGDVVQVSSSDQTGGTLSVLSGSSKKILVSPTSESLSKNGASMLKVKSSYGKHGLVRYGDEIELVAFDPDEGTFGEELNLGLKVGMDFSSDNGGQLFVSKDPIKNDLQKTSFSVVPVGHTKPGSSNQTKVPVINGDEVQLVASGVNKIWTTSRRTQGGTWREVGSTDPEKSHGRASIFSLSSIDPKLVSSVENEIFQNQLDSLKEQKPLEEAFYTIRNLSRKLGQLNDQKLIKNFSKSIESLTSKKYSLKKDQLDSLSEVISEVHKDSVANGHTKLSQCCQQAKNDINFFIKMKKSEGMSELEKARYLAKLSLNIDEENISDSQKKDFLTLVQSSIKRSKEEKRLLDSVTEILEEGMTTTGNLLTR